MAVPGRKPKPGPLRLFEGNREHRPIKPPVVKLPPVVPRMPQHLFGPGKTEWKRVTGILKHVPGLLTRVDAAILAAYCECWCATVQCSNYIANKGGYAKYLDWCARNHLQARHMLELRQARKDIKTLCAELGFTPSSRGRIELAGNSAEDDGGDLD